MRWLADWRTIEEELQKDRLIKYCDVCCCRHDNNEIIVAGRPSLDQALIYLLGVHTDTVITRWLADWRTIEEKFK